MSLERILHVDWTSERWFRMCGRKSRFGSKKKADRRARHNGLRVYACPYCAGFHLTSQEAP